MCTVFIAVLALFVVSGTGVPFFKSKPVSLPDDVSLLYGNHQNASFDQEFTLLGKNQSMTNRNDVAIVNPDFELSTPVTTLRVGENFNINSTVDPDKKRYRSVAVLLVPITSPFPPASTTILFLDNYRGW